MSNEPRNQRPQGRETNGPRGTSVTPTNDELIDGGLRLYSQGDLVGALAQWRKALEVDPDSRRARDYVRYVEQHFEILDEKFREARRQRSTAPPVEDDDGDEYDAIEIGGGGDDEQERDESPEQTPITGAWQPRDLRDRDDSVDEGWSLDGIDDFVAGKSASQLGHDVLAPAGSGYLDDLQDLGTDEASRPGEITLPVVRTPRELLPPEQPDFDLTDFANPRDRERASSPTAPAPIPPAAPAPPADLGDPRVSFRPPVKAATTAHDSDEERTIDRSSSLERDDAELPFTDSDRRSGYRAPTEDPAIQSSSVRIDDRLDSLEEQTRERGPRSDVLGLEVVPEVESSGDPDAERATTQLYPRHMLRGPVGSSRVDLQACKLEYSIVSPK